MMINEQLAYSIADVCKLLSVGRTTLYFAIKRGDLSTCKIGRRTLVTGEALQLWVSSLPRSSASASAHDGGSNGK
jgi:excisionase family DNA binding protein